MSSENPAIAAAIEQAAGPASKRTEKRVRDAYICFWAKAEARDKLDAMAKERGVTRSEMARTVFGYGLAMLGGVK